MSATLADIRAALAEACTTIPGLHTYGYGRVSAPLPCVQFLRGETSYDLAFEGGANTLMMRARVLVHDLSEIESAMLLDQYLEPTGDYSVKAAIEADTSLGGLVQDLHVTAATGEDSFASPDGTMMLGSEWTVEIWL